MPAGLSEIHVVVSTRPGRRCGHGRRTSLIPRGTRELYNHLTINDLQGVAAPTPSGRYSNT